ncbi:MAG: hypothetical protein PHE79_01925 [Eubacteriales bacterium]|nr:hypothetical protein [Eubacteriales bacterium]
MNSEQQQISKQLNEKYPVYQEYFDELVEFYYDYFYSGEDLLKFMESIFDSTPMVSMELIFDADNDCDANINIPRLMLNNTVRLCKLATDMEKIRPGKDALKITYLITCIETLYNLSGITTNSVGEKLNKTTTIIDFFDIYLIEPDKEEILSKVKRSLADSYFDSGQPSETITIEIFARIINEARNIFMHEGDYWTFSFSNSGYPELKIIDVEEKWRTGKQERIYEFNLQYEELHKICIRAFINFIKHYISNPKESH